MLNAVWMLGRSELRRRWAGVFVLVLIVGLAGTVVLATAAGARRSGSAFARFNAESRPADSQILTGHGTTTAQLDAFQRAVAGIAEVEVLNVYVLAPAARPDKLIAAETD